MYYIIQFYCVNVGGWASNQLEIHLRTSFVLRKPDGWVSQSFLLLWWSYDRACGYSEIDSKVSALLVYDIYFNEVDLILVFLLCQSRLVFIRRRWRYNQWVEKTYTVVILKWICNLQLEDIAKWNDLSCEIYVDSSAYDISISWYNYLLTSTPAIFVRW